MWLWPWRMAGGWLGSCCLIACLGAAAGLFLTRHHLSVLGHFGYLGVALIAFLGNAPMIPVFPWLVLIGPLSGLYPTTGLVIAGAVGAGLGEGLPYLVGSNLYKARCNDRWVMRLASLPGWVRLVVVLLLSLSPVFSFPGLAAGVLRIPLWAMTGMKIATEGLKLWLVLEGVSLARQTWLG